jgi:hypothetical protein
MKKSEKYKPHHFQNYGQIWAPNQGIFAMISVQQDKNKLGFKP